MRFPIGRGVRFVGHSPPMVGAGQTVNLSSSGALIASQQQMNVGARIELFVDWPVMLNGTTPLQFFAAASVVRSDAGAFALSLERHELRTMRKPPTRASEYGGHGEVPKPQYKAKWQ
jgi:hypothetical protein